MPDIRKLLRRALFAGALLFSLLLGSILTAQAQSDDRQFRKESGTLAGQAQSLATNGDFISAIKTLQTARALPNLSPYEISTIETMMGHYAYEVDDLNGAIRHNRQAIEAGGLLPNEVIQLEQNIAQLLIANGQYMEGGMAIEAWMDKNGETDKMIEYVMQSYVQAEAYDRALPWARKWFDNASPKTRKHYDLMHFLLDVQKLRSEQLAFVEMMIEQWPEDKLVWDIKVSLLSLEGREKEAYLVKEEMYDRDLFTSERDLRKMAHYHAYYDNYGKAYSLLITELAAGRITADPDILARLEEARHGRD